MSGQLTRITPAGARTILAVAWLTCFVGSLAIVFYLSFTEAIGQDNLTAVSKQINGLYAPYVGAILVYFFGTRSVEQLSTGSSGGRFVLALVVSILWNGMVLMFLLPLLFGIGTIEAAIENLRDIAALLSWLVAGAIGFYFAKPTVQVSPRS